MLAAGGDAANDLAVPVREVIYNSVADGKYVTTIHDVRTDQKRTLPLPVHFVRPDGHEAVTLDYDRLHRLRAGYGYAALPERLADQPAPDSMVRNTMNFVKRRTQARCHLGATGGVQAR